MTFRYQKFDGPGTWTCPPGTTQVFVTVVGGGGGTAPVPGAVNPGIASGGGGAVVKRWLEVSGPVPVTVGTGGTGGPAPTASDGNISYFGPAGPGPVALIPPTTVAAGGGARGGQSVPTTNRPIGGGGGGSGFSPGSLSNMGGRYGTPGIGPLTFISQSAGAGGLMATWHNSPTEFCAIGEDYYGNAGNTSIKTWGTPYGPTGDPNNSQYSPPLYTNTGSGGGAVTPSIGHVPGSAGTVIVRWFE